MHNGCFSNEDMNTWLFWQLDINGGMKSSKNKDSETKKGTHKGQSQREIPNQFVLGAIGTGKWIGLMLIRGTECQN